MQKFISMQEIISFLRDISQNCLHLDNETIQHPNHPLIFLISYDEKDSRLISASIAFKNTEDEDLAMLDNIKFQIFQLLETIAFSHLAETANDDACSYAYYFDTQHCTDPIITVSITDYFT